MKAATRGRWRLPLRGSSSALLTAVLIGLAVYLLLFLWAPLPSLPQLADADGAVRRGTLVIQSLLLFDQVVLSWFGDPPEFVLLDRLPVLLVATVIVIVSAAAGWLLMGWLGADGALSGLEAIVFALAVGFSAVSLYVLLVGLIGQLRNLWLFAVPAAATMVLAGLRLARRLPGSPLPAELMPTAAALPAEPWLRTGWLWLAVPFVAATILGGLLPPVDFDVREYHLQAPKEFFQRGQIVFLPHNVYGNMPLGPQMLALLAMVIDGDWWYGALAGKLLVALCVPMTAVALFAAGCRLFSRSAGVVAALLYVSLPWMIRVSSLGLVEGPYGFYLFLSVYALVRWQQACGLRSDAGGTSAAGQTGSGAGRLLWLSGFLAGTAVSCKYPAVLFVLVPLGGWVLLARRPPAWKSLTVYLLAALLGCGPWLGTNLLLAGNPVYPLAYTVFGGETRTAAKDVQWWAAHGPEDFTPGDGARRLAQVTLGSEWLSPLIMPLAALAVLAGRHRRLVLWLWLYFAYVILSWWLLTHRIDRFWIPALPTLALLAGLGATWTAAPLWRRLLPLILVLSLALCFLLTTSGPGGYNRYFASYQRLRTSSERVDPWHLYLNQHVPPGGAVLLVGDAQVFDLDMPVIYNTVFDDNVLECVLKDRSPAEFHTWLIDNRIAYVYVHWGEIQRYRSPGNYGFADFVQPRLFRRLVECGVLAQPAPPVEGHPGQVYMVLPWPCAVESKVGS